MMTPEDVNVIMIVYQSSPLPLGGDISQAEGERRLKLKRFLDEQLDFCFCDIGG